MKNKKAFTLTELMVVVVIVGVVAGFAIPNYQKAVDKAAAVDAYNNLKLIAAAQQIYASNNDGVYSPAATTALLNTNLNLNLIEQSGITYSCAAASCAAQRTGFWTYSISLPGTLPTCSSGTCPVMAP